MKIIFWISVLTILYVYIGYPFIVYIISYFFKQPLRGKYVYPTVSVLISVFNEQKNIENKIKDLIELGYPEERLQILIGSDGSTDKTDEVVAKFTNNRIKLLRQLKRQGKPNMLNVLAKEATGEILVFTDARQRLDKNSITELVKHFSDNKVGSVSGQLFFEGENTKTGNGVSLYWEYEKFIRKSESRIGSMLGATGALYAIRRELFPELPADLILDDVYIPMSIVQKGYRAIFDKKAKVYDRFSRSPKEEFLRKTRTLAGNFQLFLYLKWLFNPFKSLVGLQFISHKFLRLAVPFLLIAVFVSSWMLRQNYFYGIIFILQIIFYIFALFGMLFKHRNRMFDIAYMFCVMNTAAVLGLYRFLTNKQKVAWERAGE